MGKFDSFRTYIVLTVVVGVAGLLAWRLFVLSYVRHTLYASTAQSQSENIANLLIRGNIYIQDPKAVDTALGNLYLVATNKKFPAAYVVPNNVVDKEQAADKLNAILGSDNEKIKSTLEMNSSAARAVAKKITGEQAEAIVQLGMRGVFIQHEMGRSYPAGPLAATTLGFLGFNEEGRRTGQYGIEAYFDEELSGKRPADVVLTFDRNIQLFVETELDAILKKWNATAGTVIVQDPKTGKILAMADRPAFDPNSYSTAATESFLNLSVQETFEPGSSFKPLTMAAGIDLGKITPSSTYTDPGVIEIAGRQIRNFDGQSHGTVSMTTVLEKSLNTGAAWVQERIGQSDFRDYVINFGFGQQTAIDLPGEVNGNVANLYSGRQINFVTASFGQGIAVTPLQLINAYSAIANGGRLMKPYVVDHVAFEGGEIKKTEPEVASIPISEKTAQTVRSMLVNVVDRGFDKARIPGYDIAGKTGTAQIPSKEGGYEEDVFIHDFVGFAPASDPKFTILIKMDRPKGITFAADSLSPTFKNIAQYLINYYNIPPTR